MALIWRTSISVSVLVLASLSGCGPSYSPDTYAANAAQQANKVDQGVIVGVRNVGISAAGTVGTVTGAAAGGIAGSQAVPAPASAFTALGGALVGGIAGAAVEHATSDTTAYEYIVRKTAGDLVSVTQKDKTPLVLGEKVLVIAGSQARVVPDYTDPTLDPPAKAAAIAKAADAVKAADAASSAAKPGDGKPADAAPAAATSATPPPASARSASDEAPARVPAVTAPVANPLTAAPAAVPPPTVIVPANPQASTVSPPAAQSTMIAPAATAPASIVATPLTSAAAQSAASAKSPGGSAQ
jgi:outer membrane lipoprotein SlyB